MVSTRDINAVFSLLGKNHQPTMLEQFKTATPFQKIVMTLLSARAKDATVIPIVRDLFAKYPAPEDFLRLPLPHLEKYFYKIGFYKVKTKHVKALSAIIVGKYHGKVPETREEMMELPGVGRKTANCMLNYAFNKPAIAVDVHVHRIANRLGWVKTAQPEETEMTLQEIVPQEEWDKVNKLFVDHGQRICLPRNPLCGQCSVLKYCTFGQKRMNG